jgi:hypothetical protein
VDTFFRPCPCKKIQGTMIQCPKIAVVHGSGQILDCICKDIVQFSQRLLDALGNQRRWDMATIKDKLDQMSTMIMRYHACFQSNWFSGFVRKGQRGQVEMITTHEVRAVSDRGCDVNCLKEPLTCNSCRCMLQASMNALIHVVDHTNESYKANHLGWEDMISGARELLTLRGLERFADLCNDDHDDIEGEYQMLKGMAVIVPWAPHLH